MDPRDMIEKPVREAVGYMLWVMKSKESIPSKLEKPFKSIRHGNYHEFIQFINGSTGQIFEANLITKKSVLHKRSNEDDFSFLGLLKSFASLRKFHDKCRLIFGNFNDVDLKQTTFEQLVLFELAIRMHVEKEGSKIANVDLQNLISQLSKKKNMTKPEVGLLLLGNDFLNMVKHPSESKLKKKFGSWVEGESKFQEALNVLLKYEVRII